MWPRFKRPFKLLFLGKFCKLRKKWTTWSKHSVTPLSEPASISPISPLSLCIVSPYLCLPVFLSLYLCLCLPFSVFFVVVVYIPTSSSFFPSTPFADIELNSTASPEPGSILTGTQPCNIQIRSSTLQIIPETDRRVEVYVQIKK